ncbi:integral membrane family protein [Ceratobasidium sp. AG-Ba]|nr:integral membrane family protein [Ceratobasidium sp. AG-Ba]
MIPVVPAVLAIVLAAHGIRKKSLSPSGGLAAFVVGFLMMSVPLRGFGISLIIFYLTGSRVTKIGKQLKGSLEEGHNEAGYRSGWQVLCNSFSAFIASSLWAAMFAPGSIHAYLFGSILPPHLSWHRSNFNMDKTCPVNPHIGGGWSRTLLLIALGHFACCLGDTMASELGILSKSSPRLVTTFGRVPPGTNGAMSTSGTLASLAGGVIMGLTMFVSLMMDSAGCRADAAKHLTSMVFVGALGGLGGSALDSLLGATIQKTEFSNVTNRIITDETKGTPRSEGEVKVISGQDILSNNQACLGLICLVVYI